LHVRVGLHTGECELVDGKVAGIAVHTGARVAAHAEPGEVLVSSTVKDLVAGSGIAFRERGTHELKGIPGEWRLYAGEGSRAMEHGHVCRLPITAPEVCLRRPLVQAWSVLPGSSAH